MVEEFIAENIQVMEVVAFERADLLPASEKRGANAPSPWSNSETYFVTVTMNVAECVIVPEVAVTVMV
jgi:hypothetical protein